MGVAKSTDAVAALLATETDVFFRRLHVQTFAVHREGGELCRVGEKPFRRQLEYVNSCVIAHRLLDDRINVPILIARQIAVARVGNLIDRRIRQTLFQRPGPSAVKARF